MAALRYEDVRWFDVPVNDALRVGGVQRIRNFDAALQEKFQFHWSPCNLMLQGLAIEEFHHDVGLTVFLADFVNRTDVRMIQRRGGTGFASQTFECLRVFGQFLRKKLQCDMSAQIRILGFVNDTHPTPTEFREDAVVRDGLANHGKKAALGGTC